MLLASSARLNPRPGPCQEWAAVIQDVSLQVHGPHTHLTQEITASPGPGITCVPSWPPRCPVGVDATVITLLTQTSVLRLTVQLFFFLTSCFIFCLLFWTPCSLIIVPTPPPSPPPPPRAQHLQNIVSTNTVLTSTADTAPRYFWTWSTVCTSEGWS